MKNGNYILSYKSSKTNFEPGLKTKQFLGVTVLMFIFTTLEPLQWQISDLITTRLHNQEPKHRNSTVGQSGRQKHAWYPNFYLTEIKITSTAQLKFFHRWFSCTDLIQITVFALVSGSFSSHNNINLNKPNICYSDSNL